MGGSEGGGRESECAGKEERAGGGEWGIETMTRDGIEGEGRRVRQTK
jgi:hypothetical protein